MLVSALTETDCRRTEVREDKRRVQRNAYLSVGGLGGDGGDG
jgi:hypothetical protein